MTAKRSPQRPSAWTQEGDGGIQTFVPYHPSVPGHYATPVPPLRTEALGSIGLWSPTEGRVVQSLICAHLQQVSLS
jgi:hypothetical protein